MDVGRVERVFTRVVWIRTIDGGHAFTSCRNGLTAGDVVAFRAPEDTHGLKIVKAVVRVNTLVWLAALPLVWYGCVVAYGALRLLDTF